MTIGVKWTGWDGSVWDLRTGPVRMQPGASGIFNMLEAEVFARTSALRDGQVFTGWRAQPRSGLLPVLIGQSATEADWLALDRAWWRTMRHDKAGTLQVDSPDGTRRRLRLRFSDDGGMSSKRDPSMDRLSVAPLKMTADDPWWVGAPFESTFRNGSTPVNFYGGTAGFGPPYRIGSANSASSATITNLGDVDSWARYIVDGPMTSFSVTIGGRQVGGAITVATGRQLLVDSSPEQQVAWLINPGVSATNVTRQLTAIDFARIPAGEEVRLDVDLVGSGTLTAIGDTRYYKAW